MRDFIVWLLLNGGLLIFIIVLIGWIEHRLPLGTQKLRRLVNKGTVRANGELPCGANLLAAAELQSTLLEADLSVPLLTALLYRWKQDGAIELMEAPKKELQSFGAAVQPQINFLTEPPFSEPAERLLWQTLSGWAENDGTLQQNEAYECARRAAGEFSDRLEHLKRAGRHSLRQMGVSHPEEKKGGFLFSGGKREIYSPKGVRFGQGLLAYRKFCAASHDIQGEQAFFAILVGEEERLADLETVCRARILAQACVDGAKIGVRAQTVK